MVMGIIKPTTSKDDDKAAAHNNNIILNASFPDWAPLQHTACRKTQGDFQHFIGKGLKL